MISFTLSQLLTAFMAVCGGIITVSGAIAVIINWVKQAKAPESKQNERIEHLEREMEEVKKALASNDSRCNTLEEGNRVTQKALLALLSHGIDGNAIEDMKTAKSDLQKYLVER